MAASSSMLPALEEEEEEIKSALARTSSTLARGKANS
jgi:hypothetical protein